MKFKKEHNGKITKDDLLILFKSEATAQIKNTKKIWYIYIEFLEFMGHKINYLKQKIILFSFFKLILQLIKFFINSYSNFNNFKL